MESIPMWTTDPIGAAIARQRLAQLERNNSESSDIGTFREFITRVSPTFKFFRHVEVLVEQLQAVADGKSRRLLVFLPPRNSKSYLCSRLLPAYLLRLHPERWVGLASYGAELAEGFSRDARGFYLADGGSLNPSSCATSQWTTLAGGGLWATGVGGAATGRGFSLGIVDDPVKDAQQADSPTYRARLTDWWESVFSTRSEPDGAMVVVQTRWHLDDLAGHLLAKELEAEAPEGWHVINLPAIAVEQEHAAPWSTEPDWRRPGETLSPERFPLEKLEQIRVGMPARWWSALYQQRPTVAAGSVFLREWFRRYAPQELPRAFNRVIASLDAAFKAGSSSDFAALTVWGQDSSGLWLLDVVNRRMSFTDTLAAIAASWQRHQFSELLVEDAANGPAIVDTLRQQARGFLIRSVRPLGGKAARANAAAPQYEQGRVWHPRTAHWLQGFEDQLLGFPSAAHDDMVDSATQLLNHVAGHQPMRISTVKWGYGAG